MKVVVTGFDPFGGEEINPAFEAVKKLPAEIAGAEIIKVEAMCRWLKMEQQPILQIYRLKRW